MGGFLVVCWGNVGAVTAIPCLEAGYFGDRGHGVSKEENLVGHRAPASSNVETVHA